MRENTSPHFSSLAADESLEYAREAENLDQHIADLYDGDSYANRGAIGRATARIGVALKLADIHASLAVAEQIVGLRADLAPLIADLTAVPCSSWDSCPNPDHARRHLAGVDR